MTPEHRRHLQRQQLARSVALDVLEEAFIAGSAAYWERRAQQLEAARPRRSDYNGRATPADLAARYDGLSEAAAACRARAHLADLALLDLADTIDDLATPYDDLEAAFRAALDAGDRPLIDQLARLIDAADLGAAA